MDILLNIECHKKLAATFATHDGPNSGAVAPQYIKTG